MPIIYNNKSIVPAPFVSITKGYQTSDDGTIVGSQFNISLKGTISADNGSPNSSGVFINAGGTCGPEVVPTDKRLASIIRKQEGLRSLFNVEGKQLQVLSPDGVSPPINCNPRIKSIEFPEGNRVSWVDQCAYSVQLEADLLYLNGTANSEDDTLIGSYRISKASEEWNIEIADEKNNTFRLTHSVSAIGKNSFSSSGTLDYNAYQRAQHFVLSRIGLGIDMLKLQASGVLNATNLGAFNYLRSQRIDELGGGFSVSESWTCFNTNGEPAAIDEYTCQTRTSADGRTSVSVEGTITGLEERDNTTYALTNSKWTNANNKWTNYVKPGLFTRASTLSGVSLNSLVVTTSVGVNDKAGVISYSQEYDDRQNPSISGARSENITIVNHHQTDIFASIPVLGRPAGPVLQSINSTSARKKTVTIDAVLSASTQSQTPTQPNTTSIMLSYKPSSPSGVFLEQDEESWNPSTGRYSRTSSWTWL